MGLDFLAGLHLETWIAFNALIVGLLLLDLFVLHRNAHVVTIREAAITSTGWIALGLGFGGFVWW